MENPKVYLALDGMSLGKMQELLETIGHNVDGVKLHDQIDARGSKIVDMIRSLGIRNVWIDYKIHDTKDTVSARVKALAAMDIDVITVHASGGVPMMQAAVSAAGDNCQIYAVTVLTSLDDAEVALIYGPNRDRAEVVRDLASMAKIAGVHGVVCSALEVGLLSRDDYLYGLDWVVPGTRSPGIALGQQKRSATPANAVHDGANVLVVGSEVTKAPDPVAALENFLAPFKN